MEDVALGQADFVLQLIGGADFGVQDVLAEVGRALLDLVKDTVGEGLALGLGPVFAAALARESKRRSRNRRRCRGLSRPARAVATKRQRA